MPELYFTFRRPLNQSLLFCAYREFILATFENINFLQHLETLMFKNINEEHTVYVNLHGDGLKGHNY